MSIYNALSGRTMGKLPLFISHEGVQRSDREDTAWLISIKFIHILKAVSPAQPQTHTAHSVSEVVPREGSQGAVFGQSAPVKGPGIQIAN